MNIGVPCWVVSQAQHRQISGQTTAWHFFLFLSSSLLSSSLSVSSLISAWSKSITSAGVSSAGWLRRSNSISHDPSHSCGCGCTCLSSNRRRTVQNLSSSAVLVECLIDSLNKTFPLLISLWRTLRSLKRQRVTNSGTSAAIYKSGNIAYLPAHPRRSSTPHRALGSP